MPEIQSDAATNATRRAGGGLLALSAGVQFKDFTQV